MSKHIPERTCIFCRKKADKNNFIKIVKNKSGNIAIEKTEKLDGRGAYICKDQSCILGAKKSRAINRVFKTAVSEEIYEEILNDIK